VVVVRRRIAVEHQLTVAIRAVVHRQNVAMLNAAMLRLRLNVALVHQRIAGGAHVRYRAQRHASNRVTTSVWRRHRLNGQRGRHSSDRRLNAYRDRFVSNDLRRELNALRRDRHSELNGLRLRRESSGPGHNHRRSPTNRRRNRA
jgi:hypothetical protein